MTFEANFTGHCPACSDRIDVGDEVYRDEFFGYVHTACFEDRNSERPTVTCSECWLIQPCECEA